MRVVVTGGAGFIGTNLVKRLLADGMSVVVLDDFSTGRRSNLNECEPSVVVEGSVLDVDALDFVVRDADAVVHLAARPSVSRSLEDPLASHGVNATGTLLVLEAVRRWGIPHLILASSSSVYGANSALPKHEGLCPMPISPYAVSKLAGESYALAYATCFGVPVLAFRFFNVYGPFQPADHAYAAVVPSFISAALKHEEIVVHDDGLQTRDFTYVGSVAEVLSVAIQASVTADGPVNLAFGTRTSLLDLIAELESILGRSLTRRFVARRAGDVRDSQASRDKFQELFPAIAPVSFRDGLKQTIEWLES